MQCCEQISAKVNSDRAEPFSLLLFEAPPLLTHTLQPRLRARKGRKKACRMLLNPTPVPNSPLSALHITSTLSTRMADEPNNPSIATRPNRLQPTPAEAVVRGWRSSLRNQSQQQQQTQPSSSSRSPSRTPQSQPPSRRLNTTQRPPSGVSSNRLSSNPSLLSLEQPLSPAVVAE